MLTIEVPDDLAGPLADHAARRGTTLQALVLEHLRSLITPARPGSLLEFLGEGVGSVTGTGEAFSQDTGRRFADGLAEDRASRP